jgi:hypothetical protein
MFANQSVILRRIFMAGMALGSAWFFYSHTMVPLKLRENELVGRQSELRQNLAAAHQQLAAIKDSDQKVADARAVLNRMIGEKTGDAMVSFPQEVQQYFSKFGLPSATVRFVTAQDEAGLPGYRKIYWAVGLPIPNTDRNAEGLLLATAGFEQQDRYVKVIDFVLQPDVFDPSLRSASINLVTLSKK